jgi:hypothetical protein
MDVVYAHLRKQSLRRYVLCSVAHTFPWDCISTATVRACVWVLCAPAYTSSALMCTCGCVDLCRQIGCVDLP